ncbi:hypothetical protein G6F46_011186 [Rhizopus delemar]|uniref:Methyltransferase domain-containing protein n=2 Tax=Rhizopus TaxID=4842 RepID=A0A9P6Z8W8_9FUNG|nr:hypothetical protein G6F55_010542 [Rhizopus delemar]KAG1543981.1 hypothetical protein G6F51_006344 [Rhizopus arrhizus]KAG1503186.1 hypothetical protein G6F54_001844 [Rhizopus delemar]KAG1514926.1 hypothetical protein G6F53_003300 [Rhizopus delemar]KAG1519212.1 hypothetical protein G6F52_008839 [Rhizopus delemar]
MGNYSAESKQSKERMAMTQEKTTTVTADTTLVMNHTTINTNREFHSEETSSYWLPKDEEEQQRLTAQHFAFKELYNGNILRSVRENLDFEKGISVLDVGCGSGAWIMDMIHDYPNCTFYGCDILGNVVQGLPYEDSVFDFVHMRFFIFALRKEEWPIAIKELIRVTKSGGMLQLMESMFKVPVGSSFPTHKFSDIVYSIATSKGQNIKITDELEGLLSANDNVKVVQSDYRHCSLNTGTSTAKKLIWNTMKVMKTALPNIKSIIGLESEEDVLKYINEFNYCLSHTECGFDTCCISVQKM